MRLMAQNESNRYDKDEHDDFITCPRPSCRNRNAPPESDDFEPNCWNCGEHLGHQPVEVDEEYKLDIVDIHGSGAGVGHTDDGFVILVDGVLPEKQIMARVTNVKENYAWGELVNVIADEIPEEDESEPETEETDSSEEGEELGSRENWWG